MKKMVIFILFSCAMSAVNYPPEEKRSGVKRSFSEITPTEPIQLPSVEEQLVEATKNGNVAVVSAILDNTTINIDKRYAHRNTLLMIAADNGQLAVVHELLVRGADVNLKNDEGKTALHNALVKNNAPIVERLIAEPTIDINKVNNHGSTPLLSGMISESIDAVAVLLTPQMIERGLNINVANNDGETPLKVAIDHSNLALLNTLLEFGAYINQMTSEGPLIHFAMRLDDTDILKRILEIPGVRVNQRNKTGQTPLMIAAFNGNLEIAKKLLAKGAQLELKDNSGSEAFHYAALSKSPNKNKMMVLLRPK